jgi:hypothetical protein
MSKTSVILLPGQANSGAPLSSIQRKLSSPTFRLKHVGMWRVATYRNCARKASAGPHVRLSPRIIHYRLGASENVRAFYLGGWQASRRRGALMSARHPATRAA